MSYHHHHHHNYHHGNGYVNNQVIAKAALDTNGDGVITKSDFYQAAAMRNGGHVSNSDIHATERVFNRFDNNRNGRLEGPEAYNVYNYAKY
jgi:hypothetical protein